MIEGQKEELMALLTITQSFQPYLTQKNVMRWLSVGGIGALFLGIVVFFLSIYLKK